MPIAGLRLLGDVEPQRHPDGQLVLEAGHSDVEKPTFLLDIRRLSGVEIGRDTAIHRVQQEHRLPFLTLADWIVDRIR